MSNGISSPACFDKRGGNCWTGAYLSWLRGDIVLLSPTRKTLDLLLDQVDRLNRAKLEASRKVRALSKTPAYREDYSLLRSIPGVGEIVAMTLLTEICDIDRFGNERQFASYLGLVPTSRSSGEKTVHGEKTFRGNKELGPMMIESAWIAITRDERLSASYTNYCRKMKPQQAIVRVARQMSNIVFAVLKNKKKYVPCVSNG